MKAIVFDAHGPLDNMRFRDAPNPKPGPKDSVIRVRALALNGFDPMILRGIPGLKTPLPMTPGADVAGEIVALGAEIDRAQWKVGDRVTVIPNQDHGMVGETLVGGASELFATEARYLLPIPDAVSFVDAACLPVAYGAALRMMETRARLARRTSLAGELTTDADQTIEALAARRRSGEALAIATQGRPMTLGASPDRRFPSSQTRSRSSPRRAARPEAAIGFIASPAEVQRGASIDDNSDPVASRQVIAHHEKPIP
jgi:hypothetical protein